MRVLDFEKEDSVLWIVVRVDVKSGTAIDVGGIGLSGATRVKVMEEREGRRLALVRALRWK